METQCNHLKKKGDVPEVGSNDVLIFVMAAGVNYNGVWAGLGKPVSTLDMTKKIITSPVLIVLDSLESWFWCKKWKVGDEVIIHGMQWDHEDAEVNGGEPMISKTNKVFGYETADGTFAQLRLFKRTKFVSHQIYLGKKVVVIC